ncbi:hypothetical protein BG011_006798 [Mortierella polycephala]|uniref:PH domain-containing protein n=1 Tax=Mortierella polycephala TaxID=41804 RepID=A0A9P6QDS6_9FUNG|nr:hypothetical protein BG011_006798 [Mortierella polycephala]
MPSPQYTIAAVWKSFIQRPVNAHLQKLIQQVQEANPTAPGTHIPMMSVLKDCIPDDLREMAKIILGIGFSGIDRDNSKNGKASSFMQMTVLQLSVLVQYTSLHPEANQRQAVVEMLVKVFSPDEINRIVFGNNCNVLHLAAFLKMEATLDLIIAHGGDPLIENGCGLNALETLQAVTAKGFDIGNFLAEKAMRLRDSSDDKCETAMSGGYLAQGCNDVGREAAAMEEVDIEKLESDSQHADDDSSLELDMDNSPQVFHLTFDDEPDDGPLVLDSNRRYVSHPYDAPSSGGSESEGDLENSVRMVEQDAHYTDHHLQYSYYISDNLEAESDPDSDMESYQDPAYYFRRMSLAQCKERIAPLSSILKDTPGWPPENMTTKQELEFRAYREYLSTLQVQPVQPKLQNGSLKPSVTEAAANAGGEAIAVTRRMTVRWDPVKKVRVFQHHTQYQPDEDEVLHIEQYEHHEEAVVDRAESPSSLYDYARPMTPIEPSPSSQATSTAFYANTSNFINNSSVDLSAAVEGVPAFPTYTRPLPQIPQWENSQMRSSIARSRSVTPPPQLVLSEDTTKGTLAAAVSKRVPGIWSPRILKSPFPTPMFSASDPELVLTSIAKTKAEEQHTSASSDDGMSDEAMSPSRFSSAMTILDASSQWVSKVFKNTVSPTGSISKAFNGGKKGSMQLSALNLADNKKDIERTIDSMEHGYTSSTLSALISPIYDSTFKRSMTSNRHCDLIGGPLGDNNQSMLSLKSTLKGKFNNLPSCASTPQLLSFSRSLPSFPAPISQAPTATDISLDWGEASPQEDWCASTNNDSRICSDKKNHTANGSTDSNKARDKKSKVRRLALLTSNGASLNTIRASMSHLPKVTSPLANVSFMRTASRLPQLYAADKNDKGLQASIRRSSSDTQCPSHSQGTPSSTEVNRSRSDSSGTADRGTLSGSGVLYQEQSSAIQHSGKDVALGMGTAMCRKPRTSSGNQSYWKKRKEVMVVIPPRVSSIGVLESSMSHMLQESQQLPVVRQCIQEQPTTCATKAAATVRDGCPDLNIKSATQYVPTPMTKKQETQIVRRHKISDAGSRHCSRLIEDSRSTILPDPTATDADQGAMEHIHGISHVATSDIQRRDGWGSGNGLAYMGMALVNIHEIGNGLGIQRYSLRQSRTVQRIQSPDSDMSLESTLNSSIWEMASDIYSRSKRRTLSNCDSPSTTHTGVLFLRIKSVCNFTLPIPSERTMVSIRIDTGHEKVDTDYVPLTDIDILFDQEFCIPVTPTLAVTITLHLMQAPHLQPRFSPPVQIPSSPTLHPLPQLDYHEQHSSHHDSQSPPTTRFSAQSTSTLSTSQSKKRLQLPSLFRKRPLITPPPRDNILSVSSQDHVHQYSGDAFYYNHEAEAGSRYWPAPGDGFNDRDSLEVLASSSRMEKQTELSTFSKLKKGIMSVHKRRKSPVPVQSCRGITMDEVDTLRPYQAHFQPYQDQEFYIPPPSLSHPATVGKTSLHLGYDVQETDMLPLVPPIALTLPQLTFSHIQKTETPLEVLSRHILFEDELCIARSGIMFHDLRSACTNQIVNVEFMTVNNWVDLNDYSRVSMGPHGSAGMQQQYDELNSRNKGHMLGVGEDDSENEQYEDGQDDVNSDTEDNIIAKVITSLCFIPGPEMDPEDAIYEDEDRSSLEPQSLVECQLGLHYFQWQVRTFFQGRLFYMTPGHQWKEGWFSLVGSKLWYCHRRQQRHGETSHFSATVNDWEQVKCLNLENVWQIETAQEKFKTTAWFQGDRNQVQDDQDGQDEYLQQHACDKNQESDDGSFLLVRNSFRLHVRVPKQPSATGSKAVVVQDFYAESAELAQGWVTYLLNSIRERPLRPNWLHEEDE